MDNELFEKIKKSFEFDVNHSNVIRKLEKQINNGSTSSNITQDYSIELSNILKRNLNRFEAEIQSLAERPNEFLANSLLKPILNDVCLRIKDAASLTVNNKLKAAKLGMKAIDYEIDQKRIDDFVTKWHTDYNTFKDADWLLDEPLTVLAQGVNDDVYHMNAMYQFNSGLKMTVIRTAESGACEWCQALEGIYDYEDVRETGNDVWRRHERCRCVIEVRVDKPDTKLIGGTRNNKRWGDMNEALIKRRKNYNI